MARYLSLFVLAIGEALLLVAFADRCHSVDLFHTSEGTFLFWFGVPLLSAAYVGFILACGSAVSLFLDWCDDCRARKEMNRQWALDSAPSKSNPTLDNWHLYPGDRVEVCNVHHFLVGCHGYIVAVNGADVLVALEGCDTDWPFYAEDVCKVTEPLTWDTCPVKATDVW